MLGATFRWGLVGGLAIDLALGRSTRRHEDLDIAVFRNDQLPLLRWLERWELWVAGSRGSGLTRLNQGAPIPATVHGIWCRQGESEHWRFEVLVEESSADQWAYRRNDTVTLPIEELFQYIDGVPVMAPQVVLLYKGKNPRDRDTADFRAALPSLDPKQRQWLRASLASVHPTCPWLTDL